MPIKVDWLNQKWSCDGRGGLIAITRLALLVLRQKALVQQCQATALNCSRGSRTGN
jgi:hypothetical protein